MRLHTRALHARELRHWLAPGRNIFLLVPTGAGPSVGGGRSTHTSVPPQWPSVSPQPAPVCGRQWEWSVGHLEEIPARGSPVLGLVGARRTRPLTARAVRGSTAARAADGRTQNERRGETDVKQ
jgi:hypothetical protein